MKPIDQVNSKLQWLINFDGPADSWLGRAAEVIREIHEDEPERSLSIDEVEGILDATKQGDNYVPRLQVATDWAFDCLPDETIETYKATFEWSSRDVTAQVTGTTRPDINELQGMAHSLDAGVLAESGDPLSEYWHAANILDAFAKLNEGAIRVGDKRLSGSLAQQAFRMGFLLRDAWWLREHGRAAAARYQDEDKRVTARALGALTTAQKASERKAELLSLVDEACKVFGPKFYYSTDLRAQASQIMKIVETKNTPGFKRNGKLLSLEWFIKNLEDQMGSVADILERHQSNK